MTEDEKLREAILVGAKILIENGLKDWKIKLSNRRTALADCNNTRKTIRFSKHFVRVAERDEFIGVAYHEVAHALLPSWVHHGPEFVKKCIEISPNADYVTRNHPVPIHKFETNCPECGAEGHCNRQYKMGICRRCAGGGKRIPVIYSQNILKVTVW